MDEVDRVMDELTHDKQVQDANFTGLAHDVADIVEKYGFGNARLYLRDKSGQASLRRQAQVLLHVLDIIEKYPAVVADRKTARLIIKTLRSEQRKRQ